MLVPKSEGDSFADSTLKNDEGLKNDDERWRQLCNLLTTALSRFLSTFFGFLFSWFAKYS